MCLHQLREPAQRPGRRLGFQVRTEHAEDYFLKLKQFRRLATRYDKTRRSWEGSLFVANMLLEVRSQEAR